MKVVILAGGAGSRFAEETEVRPKPMIEIGGYPILWHIMRHYDYYGFQEFVLALGYKSGYIKRFFADYHTASHSMRVHIESGEVEIHGDGTPEKWIVDLVDTGRWSETGGRVKRLEPYLGGETFMLTYGDGVSDVNLDSLLQFHRSHGRLATVTAVHPPPRFGQLSIQGSEVVEFSEKPLESGWINGGFMVCEPGVLDYIEGDSTQLAKEPMERLATDRQLMAYTHTGYWQSMDSLRDKYTLEELWASGKPPWRIWN